MSEKRSKYPRIRGSSSRAKAKRLRTSRREVLEIGGGRVGFSALVGAEDATAARGG
jgi:hypothetical protein